MRRFLGALAALVLAIGGAGQVKAGTVNILYYSQGTNGTNEMAAALAALPAGYAVTTVTSPGVFQTDIATGNYQLGIYGMDQSFTGGGTTPTPNDLTALTALANFVQTQNGKAIVSSAINFGLTPLALSPFGAGTDSGTTFPPPTSINVTLSQFASGIGGTIGGPITLNQATPPYGSYAINLTQDPTFGSSVGGTYPSPYDDAIVLGNSNMSIVNGFAEDVAGAAGATLYGNEIGALAPLTNGTVPEPATLTVLGFGVAGMFGYARLRRKKRVAAA